MGVYFGKLRIGVELPPYETLRKTNHYEIRKYAPCVAAEVFVEQGERACICEMTSLREMKG